MGFRNRGGAPFWFFMALAFSVSALGTAVWAGFGLAPRSVPWFFASKLGWSDTGESEVGVEKVVIGMSLLAAIIAAAEFFFSPQLSGSFHNVGFRLAEDAPVA